MLIVPPDRSRAITKDDGTMHKVFADFTLTVSKLGVFIGTGSPEGVVEADQTQTYMDDAGSAGNIMYVKKDAAIAGDRSLGWILV